MSIFKPGSHARERLPALVELVRSSLQRAELHWLTPHEYRVRLPVKPESVAELRKLLAELHAKAPFDAVPGLHRLRWTLLESPAPQLAVSFVCDGNAQDVLEELAEAELPLLDAISRHCLGCPARAAREAWVDYLRAHRVGTEDSVRGPAELAGDAAQLRPSASEIRLALERRERLRSFLSERRHDGAQRGASGLAALRRLANEGDAAQQRLLSPLEHAVDDEGAWLRRIAHMAVARARRDVRARRHAGEAVPGLRSVHAKHHGLLSASFQVRHDLPAQFCHGVFSPGKRYDALLRPSNANLTPSADWLPDSRGLAIKLLDVTGQQLVEPALPNGLQDRSSNAQDFLLVTNPAFFVRDAHDFAIFRSLLDARPDGGIELLRQLSSSATFALRRPRELALFLSTVLRWCSHPLQTEYHSMVPFQLGPSQAVKWSVRPTAATARRLSERLPDWLRVFAAAPHDYLRFMLQRSLDQLDGAALELEFAAYAKGARPLSVEDGCADWSEAGAERTILGTLSIGAQDATSTERLAEAERLVMSPWHALEAHRPLGSLNRARLSAYRASSEVRSRGNHVDLERSDVRPFNLVRRSGGMS